MSKNSLAICFPEPSNPYTQDVLGSSWKTGGCINHSRSGIKAQRQWKLMSYNPGHSKALVIGAEEKDTGHPNAHKATPVEGIRLDKVGDQRCSIRLMLMRAVKKIFHQMKDYPNHPVCQK